MGVELDDISSALSTHRTNRWLFLGRMSSGKLFSFSFFFLLTYETKVQVYRYLSFSCNDYYVLNSDPKYRLLRNQNVIITV